MTAHQDVAGVVEKLRWLSSPDAERMSDYQRINNFVAFGIEAALLIESLSKALSEAEAAYSGLMKAKEAFRAEAHSNATRATAAESRLSEAMKLLKQNLGLLCESGDLNNYRNLSDEELGKAWTETAKRTAAFLNAGKE